MRRTYDHLFQAQTNDQRTSYHRKMNVIWATKRARGGVQFFTLIARIKASADISRYEGCECITNNECGHNSSSSVTTKTCNTFINMLRYPKRNKAYHPSCEIVVLRSPWSLPMERTTYPTYSIPTIARRMTSKISIASWAPVPTKADKRTRFRGDRNTSPWTSFQPDSSLTSLSCRYPNPICSDVKIQFKRMRHGGWDG